MRSEAMRMALELVSVPSRTHWPASGPPRTKIRLPAVIATSPEAEPTAMPPGRASVRPRTTRLVPARVRSPRSVVTARFPAASSVSRTAWPARATEAAPVPRTSAATASQRPASAVKLPSRVVMAALMAMSRAASSRRSPVPVQLSGTATVMSPGICASGGAEVVTVTSAPPLRAFSSAMRLTTSAPPGSGPPGPSAIRMSWGSSSQRVADTFAAAPIASATRPEVSTKPPAPRAESVPSTRVSPSDQATIRPPRAAPSAASSAPASIATAVARRRVPPPCASPPIRIEPPVVPPRAATLRRARDVHPGAGRHDVAALGGTRGVERPRDPDAAAAARDELDPPALAGSGIGADDAGGVDRGVERLRRRAGAEQDAVAFDAAAVRDAAVAVDDDPDHAVAGEVDGAAGAAGERDRAAPGDDDAGVLDLAADQRRQPGLADGDPALVDDARAGACRRRSTAAVPLEAVGVDRLAGRDQPADVDAGAAGEEHAGAVLDDDRAGRPDRALDDARPRRQHPVQRRRVPAGLPEDHLVVAADVEAAPVDHRALRGLPDRRPAGAWTIRAAADHGPAFGAAGRCGFGQHERQERCAEHRQDPCRPRHSARGGGYRHAKLHVQGFQSRVVSRRIATKSTGLFRAAGSDRDGPSLTNDLRHFDRPSSALSHGPRGLTVSGERRSWGCGAQGVGEDDRPLGDRRRRGRAPGAVDHAGARGGAGRALPGFGHAGAGQAAPARSARGGAERPGRRLGVPDRRRRRGDEPARRAGARPRRQGHGDRVGRGRRADQRDGDRALPAHGPRAAARAGRLPAAAGGRGRGRGRRHAGDRRRIDAGHGRRGQRARGARQAWWRRAPRSPAFGPGLVAWLPGARPGFSGGPLSTRAAGSSGW